MRLRRHIASFAICLLASGATLAAHAETYPSKPVKIIVQTPAGNGPDVILRIIADRLGSIWQQQPVIINRPGAGGLLAAQAAVAAEPDGYTLFDAITSTLLILPVTQNLSFDLNDALLPIGQAGDQPFVIGVSPSPRREHAAGIDRAGEEQARQDTVRCGAARKHAASCLRAPALARGHRYRLCALSLHHAGSAGHCRRPHLGDLRGHVGPGRADKGRLDQAHCGYLAATVAELPNIPAAAETVSGYRASGWFVLMARAGTPDAIVQKLNRDLRSVLSQPELQEKLAELGTYVQPMSVAETAQFIKSEQKLWQPIARKLMASQ